MTELFNAHGWRIVLESASLPDGRETKAVRAHYIDAVNIIAFPHEKAVLLLREYRPFWESYVWMLPSGKVDKEHDIEAAAQRELQEETGYYARDLRHYCSTVSAESIARTNHIFLARELHHKPLAQDEDELIEVHEFPLEEAIDRVLGSDFVHTPSAYALLRYARERKV